jgi:uncharacterized protein YbbK (DUF523 family)
VAGYGPDVVDGTGVPLPDRGCSLLVSACLLGVPCTDDGRPRTADAVVALGRRDGAGLRLVPVCPETAGGLPTPRPRAERSPDGTVRTADGDDLTDAYERGARHAVALAAATGATVAVLKARSPSCGCRQVYDGSHSRTLVDGEGTTAAALRAAGVQVVSDEELLSPSTRPGPRGG